MASKDYDSNWPTVTVGCPVRNRQEYIPHYLEAISKLIYPKENITLLFVLNDNSPNDSTPQILQQFKKDNQHLYHKIQILTWNLNASLDARIDSLRREYTYTNLSKLRNYWMAQIKTNIALSCDSDIMLKPDTLTKLMRHNVDYCAGLICNGFLYNPSNPYKYTNMLTRHGSNYIHINDYPDDALLRVGFSGAVFLVSKKAAKLGRFSYHHQGEDCSFCESLQAQGIDIFVDTSAKCCHCMDLEYLKKYIDGEFVF